MNLKKLFQGEEPVRKELKQQLEEVKQEQAKAAEYTHVALSVYRDTTNGNQWTLGSIQFNPITGEVSGLTKVVSAIDRASIEFEFKKNASTQVFDNRLNNA